MNANAGRSSVLDQFIAELADRTLPVVSRYGVNENSVDLELGLWHALGDAVTQARRRGRLAANDISPSTCRDQLLARLTDAAYHVVLGHGFSGSFLELELGLWRTVDRVSRQPRFSSRLFRGEPIEEKSGSARELPLCN